MGIYQVYHRLVQGYNIASFSEEWAHCKVLNKRYSIQSGQEEIIIEAMELFLFAEIGINLFCYYKLIE